MDETIGFIGLGNMGRPMAERLLSAGFRLCVYNRTADRARDLAGRGAVPAEAPAGVAEPGGIVVTMLSDDAAIEGIASSPGFLDRLGAGGVHLAMGTHSPAAARRLAALHRERGSDYVACPVFGRPDAAAGGNLWLCLAGPAAARRRVRSLLDALGKGVFEYGEDPGAANLVKLAGNFLIAASLEAMGEAAALAEKGGIGPADLLGMLSSTLFACPIYQNYGRMVAEKRVSPAGFRLELGLKDVSLLLAAASDARVPMPLASLVRDRLLSGLARGRGDLDWTALAMAAAEEAGVPGTAAPGLRTAENDESETAGQ